ncbi:hypothetical protein Tco_1362472 [Tanacetum coccineum]
MTTLQFAYTHNLVAFLSKPAKSEGFEQIVDFLNANPIRYALTINPTIYTSCIEQFWATVKAKTINGEVQLQALVDGKKIIITESIVRRDLQLEDAEDNVADEAVNEEMDDSLERAATTATSLDAEQDRGNINKTQSKATPNEPSTLRTSSGGGPRRQETMRDTISQTRSENVSKHSNDPLLVREHKDCSSSGDSQSLILRCQKLERKDFQDSQKSKRLYKVGRSARMVSSDDASLGQDMDEKEINVAEKEVSTADPVTTTGEVVTTASPTETITANDLTHAQTFYRDLSAKIQSQRGCDRRAE